jgi:type II secretory pathway component PulL
VTDAILALDISEDLVAAVLAKKTGKTWSVAGCAAAERGDRPVENVIGDVVREAGLADRRCQFRVALAAHNFSFRSFALPFHDVKKIRQVLAGEISEVTPFNIDDLVYEFLTVGKGTQGTMVQAAMIERQVIAEEFAHLQAHAIRPAIVTISGMAQALALDRISGEKNFFYLDVGLRRASLVRVAGGKIHLLRSLNFCAAGSADFSLKVDGLHATTLDADRYRETFRSFAKIVRQTLLASSAEKDIDGLTVFLGGPMATFPGLADVLRAELPLQVETYVYDFSPGLTFSGDSGNSWPPGVMERAMALVLLPERDALYFNFRGKKRSTGIAPARLATYLKFSAVPALLALVAVIALAWHDRANLVQEQKRLDEDIRKIFTQALPDVTRIVDPVKQLKSRVDEARKAYMTGGDGVAGPGMMEILAEISSLVPSSLQVKIVRLTADQNDIRLRGTTDNYSAVEAIRKGLERSPLFTRVDFSSATQSRQSGAIDFELAIRIRR